MEDWGAHMITLHFELDDYNDPLNPENYSSANKEEWLVKGQIEYCLVQSFTAPGDLESIFTVGNKRKTI
jgi:hypothetical protein